MALTDKLTDIADAIRAKTGSNATMTLAEMPTAIANISGGDGGSSGLPGPTLQELTYTSSIESLFQTNNNSQNWGWFFAKYAPYMTFTNISNAQYAFLCCGATDLSGIEIVFDPNYDYITSRELFARNSDLEYLPIMTNWRPYGYSGLYNTCPKLKYIPNNSLPSSLSPANIVSKNTLPSLFTNCYSLRQIPSFWTEHMFDHYQTMNQAFYMCYCLDGVTNLRFANASNITSNKINEMFYRCYRIQHMTFALENGSPAIRTYKNQTLSLANVGWTDIFLDSYGIPNSKIVSDATSYALLKNDPDWYSNNKAYSRYNHTSAVETINSLPDTSAYGTNTIVFDSNEGSATDGGAVGNLTSAEIAVATAKGWTVSLI